MRIIDHKRTIQASGYLDKAEFHMAMSSFAMDTLSKLYSDPIYAIVREYGTNMYDAVVKKLQHKGVIVGDSAPANIAELMQREGIRAPIIHLPNALEPYISFQDFGVGLDKDDILKVYSGYFVSTKNQTNAEVGGFGLGGKSAFAYPAGEQFQVESVFNGTSYFAVAAKDEHNVPNMFLMAAEPTTEENGVTVSIPVSPQDFEKFAAAVKRFLWYFPIPIEVMGRANFKTEKPNYTLRGTNWGLKKRATYSYYSGEAAKWKDYPYGFNLVVMGNVAYPLDFQHHLLGDLALDLFMDVGSCELPPNREALMYSEITNKALEKVLAEIEVEISTLMSDQLKECKTAWDAITKVRAFKEYSMFQRMTFEWQGRKIHAQAGIEIPEDTFVGHAEKVRLLTNDESTLHIKTSDLLYTHEGKTIQDSFSIPFDRADVFLTDGKTPRIWGRARNHTIAKSSTKPYYGSRTRFNHKHYTFVIESTTLTKEQASALLSGCPVQDADDLHDEKEGAETVRGRVQFREIDNMASAYPVDMEINDSHTYYYVDMERDDLLHPQQIVRNIIDVGRQLGWIVEKATIVGVPRTLVRYTKRDNFIDLVPFVRSKLAEYIDENAEKIATFTAFRLNYGKIDEFRTLHNIVSKLVSTNPALENNPFLEPILKWQPYLKEANNVYSTIRAVLDEALQAKLDAATTTVEPEADKNNFYKMYPLLKYVNLQHYSYNQSDKYFIDALMDYIS